MTQSWWSVDFTFLCNVVTLFTTIAMRAMACEEKVLVFTAFAVALIVSQFQFTVLSLLRILFATGYKSTPQSISQD